MAAKKKSGRITMRTDPDIHARLEKTAKGLGLDLNGLLNLIVRTHLRKYEDEAYRLTDPRVTALLPLWRDLNPIGEVDDFYHDLEYLRKGSIVRFFNDKWYRMNDTFDGFLEVPESEISEMRRGRRTNEREATQE